MCKYKYFLIILVIIVLYTNSIFADDLEIEETLKWNEEILETGKRDDEPTINSRSAIIYDRKSKKIIWSKNSDERRAMASTTKMMTGIIVLEKSNLNDVATISKKAAGTGGSRLGLKEGDQVTIENLLYGLLLVSGNDAAVALAEHIGGSVEEFSGMMNEKAKSLGLKNSNFITPHGLDMPEHYSTALELAKIADYALNNEKFASIVNTKSITISLGNRSKTLNNTNELLGNLNGVNGVKTGFTNGANRCLVSSVNRNNMNIIVVVLGADTKKDRTKDSVKLIEYAYNNYEIFNIHNLIDDKFNEWKRINENRINIVNGKKKFVKVKLDDINNYNIPIKKVDKEKINVKIYSVNELEAPICKGTYIGKMNISIKDDKIMEIVLRSDEEIEKLEIKDYFKILILSNWVNMQKII